MVHPGSVPWNGRPREEAAGCRSSAHLANPLQTDWREQGGTGGDGTGERPADSCVTLGDPRADGSARGGRHGRNADLHLWHGFLRSRRGNRPATPHLGYYGHPRPRISAKRMTAKLTAYGATSGEIAWHDAGGSSPVIQVRTPVVAPGSTRRQAPGPGPTWLGARWSEARFRAPTTLLRKRTTCAGASRRAARSPHSC